MYSSPVMNAFVSKINAFAHKLQIFRSLERELLSTRTLFLLFLKHTLFYYIEYLARCICPFHTLAEVKEVTEHFDSNWTVDCFGSVTSGKQDGQQTNSSTLVRLKELKLNFNLKEGFIRHTLLCSPKTHNYSVTESCFTSKCKSTLNGQFTPALGC